MLINYLCNTCQNKITKIIDFEEDIKGVVPCGQCGGFLERSVTGPSSNAVEIIDNGFMPKTVEYDAERAEQRKEAAKIHFKELYGDKN